MEKIKFGPSDMAQAIVEQAEITLNRRDNYSTKFQQLAAAVERSRQGCATPADTMFILQHCALANIMAKFKTSSNAHKKL
jgi:hypothetical protein